MGDPASLAARQGGKLSFHAAQLPGRDRAEDAVRRPLTEGVAHRGACVDQCPGDRAEGVFREVEIERLDWLTDLRTGGE